MTAIGPYDYSGLIKSYFAQDRITASTAEGRMSFSSTKLYSYDSCLAELNLTDNILFIDEGISKYSNTTKGHVRKLLMFIPAQLTVFHIDLDESIEYNFSYYMTQVSEYITRCKAARKPHMRKSWFIGANDTYIEALNYAKCTSMDKRSAAFKQHKSVLTELIKLKFMLGD